MSHKLIREKEEKIVSNMTEGDKDSLADMLIQMLTWLDQQVKRRHLKYRGFN